MKKLFFFAFTFLLLSLSSFAQADHKVDSMKALLRKELVDTTRVHVYTQLANTLRFTDPKQQKEYAIKGIELSRKINFQRGLADSYNMYAIGLENEGQYDYAIAYYDSSLAISKQLNNLHEQAKIYLNESNVYNRTADYSTAVDLCLRSLKLQEILKDTFGIAVCKLTLGNIYFNQGNAKEALKNYQEGWRLNHLSENNVGFEGSVVMNIGAMFENLIEEGDSTSPMYDSAMTYFRLGLKIFSKYNITASMGSAYDNMGSTFKAMGQLDSAIFYYRKGLSLNFKMERTEQVAGCYLSLGNFYRDVNNPDSALFYYNKSLLIAKATGLREYEKEIYFGISGTYEKKKDFELALSYMHKYNIMNDSLHSEKETSEVDKIRKGYDIDKKNRELLQLATEKKLSDEGKRRDMIWYISGSVLMLIVIIVGFVMYRNKQKHNLSLEKKNEEISQQKEEITASITYARRIQQSVMPDERILQKSGVDYFILNKPRDIVSGDFYWLAEKEGRTYIAVVDCTGHGVPGALVSVIGINMLNKIIEQPGAPSPSEILELLHVLVIHALNKDATARDTNDGMDIGLLCIDNKKQKAFFAGAGRPLHYSDVSGFHVIKGDRYSVAGEKKDSDPPFSEHEIPLTGKVSFYLSSDGYVDQFGEATGKKFLSKNFHELLASFASLPMKEQATKIETAFDKWKGKLDQVDDVMVIGVKI